MKRLVVTFAILLGLAAPAWAGYFEGLAAYNRDDYARALREWRPLAEQGHAKSQNKLGIMYRRGRGVPQDYAEAVKWYRKAAVQGFASAQKNLGFMYRKGRGVPQDYTEAAKWYRRAAKQGHAKAQLNLGTMYRKGLGVPQDSAAAARWYRRAADQGHAMAQNTTSVSCTATAGRSRRTMSVPTCGAACRRRRVIRRLPNSAMLLPSV